MKRVLSFVLLSFVMLSLLTSCGYPNRNNIKIGLILYSDESDSYCALHIDAINKATNELKISNNKVIIKKNVAFADCYGSINELLKDKCSLIFSVGNGFEDYMVQSAGENEKVQYCVCNGLQASTADMPNLHSYSTREFESRYVAGVAAGMKLNDLIDNGEIAAVSAKIGYIGSVKNVENTSAYSAFYLGAKSVCSDVSMQIQFSGAEHNGALEEIAAKALIANGSVLLAQQSYFNGAAETCEEYGKYFVGSLNPAIEKAPNYAVTSVSFDWTETYKYPIEQIINGEDIDIEWCKGVSDVNAFTTEINESAFTFAEVSDKAKKEVVNSAHNIIDGKLYVFDTSTFTVNGEQIKSTLADDGVPKSPDGNDETGFGRDVEYISDSGYFMENELSSTPKFDLQIDGIEVLN